MVCFASPPLFPLASLLLSSNSNKSACTLKEGSHLHGPPAANLLFLIEFYDFRRQCATELSVVAAANQIYSFQASVQKLSLKAPGHFFND